MRLCTVARAATLRVVIRDTPHTRAVRLRRTLAVLLSFVLLLQTAIAGACAAHDAAHGNVDTSDAAAHASAGDSHAHPAAPQVPDPGEPEALHAILHAAHCGGCAHGATATVHGLGPCAAVAAAVQVPYTADEPLSYSPDPSLRPPISA